MCCLKFVLPEVYFFDQCLNRAWAYTCRPCMYMYVHLYVHIHTHEEESNFSGMFCCVKNKPANNSYNTKPVVFTKIDGSMKKPVIQYVSGHPKWYTLCSTALTPDPRCRGDHVYKECGSHCGSTCQNLYGPQPVCDESCFEGCFCSDGLIPLSSSSSKCFYRDECPPPRCPGDKVFTTCGTACPQTCENKDEIIPCTLQCVPGECVPGDFYVLCTCIDVCPLINPRRACAPRVTVVVLCVCL